MAVCLGSKLLAEIMRAVGVSGPVRRIVLDIPYNAVPTVYVQRLLQKIEADAAIEALQECERPTIVEAAAITVDEKGNVRAERE